MNNKPIILPRFVVFEGIDGSGKSTQAQLVTDLLAQERIGVSSTYEPQEGKIGTFIRNLLSDPHSAHIEPKLLAGMLTYLFAADRYEHVYAESGILRTHNDTTHIIISDRYLFSSLAYQQESFIPDLATHINQFFPLPRIIFYFEISPQEAFNRMQKKNKDIMEHLTILQAHALKYRTILDFYTQHFSEEELIVHTIDAMQPMKQITSQIVSFIKARI